MFSINKYADVVAQMFPPQFQARRVDSVEQPASVALSAMITTQYPDLTPIVAYTNNNNGRTPDDCSGTTLVDSEAILFESINDAPIWVPKEADYSDSDSSPDRHIYNIDISSNYPDPSAPYPNPFDLYEQARLEGGTDSLSHSGRKQST
jgi:hypothetical protein